MLRRWKNHLDPNISKTPWTEEEDALVESLRQKYGNQWKKIALEVPGRYVRGQAADAAN